MKVKHIFGGHIYLISSFGVARNPIFKSNEDAAFFKHNMSKYLNEICDIFAYSHLANEFQYLVQIKERPILENFFYKKQALQKKNVSHSLFSRQAKSPPGSYLIFSQEVSNCLNSYAKKFNFKYKRKGGLFGDRYCKHLIESNEEMEMWIEKLNSLEKLVGFSKDWQVCDEVQLTNECGESSSKVYYEGNLKQKSTTCIVNFALWVKSNMRGCFSCLPPFSIRALDFQQKFQDFTNIKGFPPPW